LIARIQGWWPFAIFGLGLELLSAIGLLYLFRKRGWLGGPTN
jgi:LPXTG-motif cell wall-anchored protein